jgi:hypothetical protein
MIAALSALSFGGRGLAASSAALAIFLCACGSGSSSPHDADGHGAGGSTGLGGAPAAAGSGNGEAAGASGMESLPRGGGSGADNTAGGEAGSAAASAGGGGGVGGTSFGPTITCTPVEITVDGTNDTWAATHVHGNVTAPAGIESVSVNDVSTSPEASGDFSAAVEANFGANAFHVIATDRGGVTSERYCPFNAAAEYRPEHMPTPDSVLLALGQNAVDDDIGASSIGPMDSLGDVVDAGIDAVTLGEVVDAYLRTQPETQGLGYYIGNGCVLIFCVDVYYQPSVQKVQFASESIDLALEASGLRVLVDTEGLSLGIQSEGVVGLASSSGVASVASTTAQADYAVTAKDGLLDATITPGTFASESRDISVNVDNFLVDLVSQIFPGLVDRILEHVFEDVVSAVVNDLLHALTVEALGVGTTLPKLDGSGELALDLTGGFSSANVNASRLLAGIAPIFGVTGAPPSASASAGVAAKGDATRFDPPLASRSVAFGIHEEAINRLIHQLWRHGYFDTTLDAAALESLGVNVAGLADLFRNSDLTLAAPLPPIVSNDTDGSNLRVGLAGVRLTLAPHDDSTPFEFEVFALLDVTPALSQETITIGNITEVASNTTVLAGPGSADAEVRGQLTASASAIVRSLLVDVLGQSLIAVRMPRLELPQTLGPIELDAPVVLGLFNPTLAHQTHHLIVNADFTQLP